MKDFKIIATFNFAHEIIILKHRLDQLTIPYLFENENLIGVNPFGSIAYGGIKLKVHSNDFELVQTILDELNNNLEIV